jgi:hypothetical protein
MMQTTARNHDRTFGHIDLSTGDEAPHVTRFYTLVTNLPEGFAGAEVRRDWTFALRIPRTIDEALTAEDWEFVCRRMDTRDGFKPSPVEYIIFTGKLKGVSSAILQRYIGEQVSEALYKMFVRHQIKAGNKAWLAPTSMQGKAGDPNGGY